MNFFIVHTLYLMYRTTMQATIYHEIDPSSLEKILREGIKRTSQGDKSKDKAIQKLDLFLDTHRPQTIAGTNLSRSNNIYGYVSSGEKLIDITDGEQLSLGKFRTKSHKTIVHLTVDPARCYVSDLDLYDTLKRAMELNEQDSTRESLAVQYWNKLVPLEKFAFGTIRRPEVMVTYDILPANIEVIDSDAS